MPLQCQPAETITPGAEINKDDLKRWLMKGR